MLTLRPLHFSPIAIIATVLLTACAGAPGPGGPPLASAAAPAGPAGKPDTKPAATPAAAQASAPEKPMDVHEASSQCWMKYESSKIDLDAKAKIVDKCIDQKMAGQKKP
jgi:hypothetical protein